MHPRIVGEDHFEADGTVLGHEFAGASTANNPLSFDHDVSEGIEGQRDLQDVLNLQRLNRL